MDNVKDYWSIPVTWQMCGEVKIPKSKFPRLEDAMKDIQKNAEDYDLPDEQDYVDGSFENSFDIEQVDDVRYCYNNDAPDLKPM